MKWICYLAAVSLLWLATGCGQGNTPAPVPADSGIPPVIRISGVYEDTLPCVDCAGILSQLVLAPDSTFTWRERRLDRPGEGQAAATGRFVLEGEKLTLNFRNGQPPKFLLADGDGYRLLDPQGEPLPASVDYTLDRLDRFVSWKNGVLLRYLKGPASAARSTVFTRTAGNEITIDKPFLDAANPATRAVLAFYALRFEAACTGDSCALLAAMNLTQPEAGALCRQWMAGDRKALDSLAAGRGAQLQALFIRLLRDEAEIIGVIERDGKPTPFTDRYRFTEGAVAWQDHTEGLETRRQVIERRTNRPAEYPQGGKQVIDMKKLRESGKKQKVYPSSPPPKEP